MLCGVGLVMVGLDRVGLGSVGLGSVGLVWFWLVRGGWFRLG